MIRKLRKDDIERVAHIWLVTNESAHDFIPAAYWRDNFATVKEMLLQAEVYVYEAGNGIQGFVGLSGDHIAGIFVCEEAQSKGIGKQLLDYVKGIKKRLSLSVYQKNIRAVRFYKREQFQILQESTDENTGEKEYQMMWGL